MAEKILIIDDLDGAEADERLDFSVDGRSYRIDLKKANADKFRKALAPFIEAATETTQPTVLTRASKPRGGSGLDYSGARVWAAENGLTVSARGRLSTGFMDAYAAKDVEAAKSALAS